jgi:hypothetical protein
MMKLVGQVIESDKEQLQRFDLNRMSAFRISKNSVRETSRPSSQYMSSAPLQNMRAETKREVGFDTLTCKTSFPYKVLRSKK